MTTILPTDRPIRYCITGADEPIIGMTHVGELTGVNPALTAIVNTDENAFLGAVSAVAFPALPDSGWLEADAIYTHKGAAVMVRQSHYRTHYEPAETLALFIVYREDTGDVLEWVAGEKVDVGTQRMYAGTLYTTLQAHVTQSDWTPDKTPALWALVVPPTAEWTYPVAYTIGDIVTHLGKTYKCRQSHVSQAGWTPAAVLALWLPL